MVIHYIIIFIIFCLFIFYINTKHIEGATSMGEKGSACATDGECDVYKQLLCIKEKCRKEWNEAAKNNIRTILKKNRRKQGNQLLWKK